MRRCDYCNSLILSGGIRGGGNSYFCNEACRQDGLIYFVSREFPEETVEQRVHEIQTRPCPICKKRRGSVGIHFYYKIWSLLKTWGGNYFQISCRFCGIKAQAWAIFSSTLFGWWGLDGVKTPVQIARNVGAICDSINNIQPLILLEKFTRIALSENLLGVDLELIGERLLRSMEVNKGLQIGEIVSRIILTILTIAAVVVGAYLVHKLRSGM